MLSYCHLIFNDDFYNGINPFIKKQITHAAWEKYINSFLYYIFFINTLKVRKTYSFRENTCIYYKYTNKQIGTYYENRKYEI